MIVPGVVAAARFGAAAGITELALGANAFNYTGTKVIRVVPAGVKSVRLKLWGAGGGPGIWGNNGGSGGHVFTTIEVDPGDVLLIQVGGGASRYKYDVPRNGGAAGWPDGGEGGTTTAQGGGGGGGSTRVYRNGALAAIAAGGGGGGISSGGAGAGHGGGFMGLRSIANTYIGSGGHSTDGGDDGAVTNAANPFSRGTYLKGGRGWATGSRFIANVLAATGGGGGGGWYGGSGGGAGSSGSGGSSTYSLRAALERLNATLMTTAVPANGVRSAAPAALDPSYPGNNVGTGGSATFAAAPVQTDGGHGFVEITTYANVPEPVRVTHQTAEVISLPLGAVRVTQQTSEVAYTIGTSPVRVTHQAAEILHVRPIQPVRVTQQTVEVIRSIT